MVLFVRHLDEGKNTPDPTCSTESLLDEPNSIQNSTESTSKNRPGNATGSVTSEIKYIMD